MTVLIVNDEMFMAQIIAEEVNWESCGVDEVKLAYEAESARKQIEEGPVDILLCDIEMPGENGIELMRWVRSTGMEMECIFLTCHADFLYAQEAIRLDCQDYILMPARTEEIEMCLRKVVRRIRQKRSSGQLEHYGQQWVRGQRDKIEAEEGKRTGEQVVADSKAFIQANLSNMELSVSRVAEECHLSSEYLNRIFRRETGTSIGQYIIRERMELAGRLLREGTVSATAVGEAVGYANYSYFSTSFKKYYGSSPQSYLRKEGKG